MKNIIALILIMSYLLPIVNAAEFDSSVDNDIRKKYNVEELPALPKVSPNKVEMPKEQTTPVNNYEVSTQKYKITGKTYTIPRGTKIILISKNKVSNWNSVGSKINFVSQNPIPTREGIVIPSGTLFKGTVTDSHRPQMTGNGGLVELHINEIYYNGLVSAINTKLTHIDSKRIIGSDIKGKRKYWQNCGKAMTPGVKTFKVMKKAAKALTPYPVINILSIVPFTIGTAAYLVNLPLAPIASVFMKGGSISIPADTAFYVKTSGNNQIRG